MPEITNKGFKEGLESLLADAWHEDFQEQTTLFTAPAPPSKRASKASGGKHFSDNLSNLLEEALKETIAEKTQSLKEDDFSTPRPKNNRALSGLDNLIRSTVESSRIEIHEANVRRVTFVFEEDKIEKLKTIARLEKTYLKNVIHDIVTEYIAQYEQQRGKIAS